MPQPQLPTVAPPPPPPAAATGPSRPATWQDIADAEATKQGVDPKLVRAMASVESGFNPSAVSPAGARGVMQLMPATAQRLGVNIDDPVENIRGGVTEIKRLLDQHKGDMIMALRQYNASPGAAPAVTEPYVQQVLGRLQQGQAGAPPQAAQSAAGAAGGPPPLFPASLPGMTPQPAHTTGQAGLPPPAPPKDARTWGQLAWDMGKDAVSAFDPRASTGRRNLAGAAGAALAAGAVAASAPVSLPMAGLVGAGASVLGAGAGGALAETGEQLAGTAPPSIGEVGKAGLQQAAYETVGQGVIWPVKALGRRVIASSVGQSAKEGLHWARQLSTTQLEDAFAAASDAGQALKGQAGAVLQGARDTAASGIRSARQAMGAAVGQAEKAGEGQVALQQGRYAARAAQGAPPEMAGQAANAVLEGPAKLTRDRVGQSVEAAAKSGPPVNITKLKASAQEIVDRLSQSEASFPRKAGQDESLEGMAQAAGIDLSNLRHMTVNTGPPSMLAEAQKASAQDTLKHPAFGVLNRILNADDIVPFHDAHLWKSELQNSLAGTYDKTQKKQVTSITQHLTGQLREALAVHEPYNAATAAYKKIVPLYTTEYAARIKKTALTQPETLVRLIDPKKPTAAGMLHDLLVKMPEGPDGVAQGQQAWDLVRSAWTKSKVLTGGVEGLQKRLDTLPDEFVDHFYGDESGQQVLHNLRSIAQAYTDATVQATQGVEAARSAGQVGVQAAQSTGRQQVAAARQTAAGMQQEGQRGVSTAREALREGRKPTAAETKFAQSSLARSHGTIENVASAGIQAATLGPGSRFGALALIRLIKGPREADLLEWMAYSSPRTQAFVRAMTGTASPTGMAMSDLVRASGILQPQHQPQRPGGPPSPPATPPPSPGR